MRIALVSLEQIWEDKNANITLCEDYIKYASKNRIELIIFPEMTLTGYSMNIAENSENKNDSNTINSFKKFAAKYNIAIVFGVIISENNRKGTNRAYFVNNKGEVLDNYSKIHPFSFAHEDKFYLAGNKMSITSYKSVNFALTICYDLRFPDLYSLLSEKSDVIINIANWPKKRVEHWKCLLKARAIENQLYLIGVNRIGIDGNNLEYEESSCVFNANGDMEQSIQSYNDMKIFEISKESTKLLKEEFNSVEDKKFDLYNKLMV